MRPPMERFVALREAIERWRRTEARSVLDAEVAPRYPAASWAREVQTLSDAWAPGEAAAIAAHLARARAEPHLAALRARLRERFATSVQVERHVLTIGEALVASWSGDARAGLLEAPLRTELGDLEEDVVDARRAAGEAAVRAWRAAGGERHADAGPPDRVESAEAFLEASEDAGREAWSRLGSWPFAPLPGFPAKDRFRRLAEMSAGLGFVDVLRARARVEPPHDEPQPRARVVLVSVPDDVRLVPSRIELGWVSELDASEALGRATMRALANPGLPVALRRAAVGSTARAYGALHAQLLGDPAALARRPLFSRREAEEAARSFGAACVLGARMRAACVLGDGGERLESVLGRSVPRVVRTAWVGPSGAGARWRGTFAGLALWGALRERYDEDWYRNPRAAETIRGVAERSGWTSAESWLEELGVEDPADLAIRRVTELLG